MDFDVELMRDLMFSLEARQLSPRSTVILSLAETASELGCSQTEVARSLDALLDFEYIDGAGQDDERGFWLFRKLTRKGVQFVRATREPRDWERMKRRFEAQGAPPH